MPTELDLGFKKGKIGKSVGSDEIPNEAFAFMDRQNKTIVTDSCNDLFCSRESPDVWSEAEKRYIDQKD